MDAPSTPAEFIEFLTSEDAYMVAAGVVFLVVWAIPRIPALAALFVTELQRAGLALAMSVLPAIGLALMSHAPAKRIIAIALVALLAGLTPPAPKPVEPKSG